EKHVKQRVDKSDCEDESGKELMLLLTRCKSGTSQICHDGSTELQGLGRGNFIGLFHGYLASLIFSPVFKNRFSSSISSPSIPISAIFLPILRQSFSCMTL